METKKDLRKKLLILRKNLTEEYMRAAEESITLKLTGLESYPAASVIFAYAAYNNELGTMSFINRALADKKRVYLPKVKGRDLFFYEIRNSLTDLDTGYKGIPEPKEKGAEFDFLNCSLDETMLIIPGVGFDELGNRLGYGGGFYDRFFEKYPFMISKSIAIGYKFQSIKSIPVEANDIKPNYIILV